MSEYHERRDVTPVTRDAAATDEVRRTIERARVAIQSSIERTARGQALLERTTLLADESQRLREASLQLRTQLRSAVTTYVRNLRDAGTPPERVLVSVKGVVRESFCRELSAAGARALLEDVVRWSIDAYYDAA